MTGQDLALLLALLGGVCLATAWVGRRTGDAARDVWLTLGTGGVLLACGGWVLVG